MKIQKSTVASILFLFSLGCTKPGQEPKAAEGIPLFNNLGTLQHPVTTSNELAGKYFDQGLRLVYGFNHDEAERAFREAARLDPGLAMAWWGVAYSLGPNYNLAMDAKRNGAALEAVQQAQ